MNKIKDFYKLLVGLSDRRLHLWLIASILPILIMAGYGLVLAFKFDYWLSLSLLIACSVFVIIVPSYYFFNNEKQVSPLKEDELSAIELSSIESEQSWRQIAPDLSEQELAIWRGAKTQIQQQLQDNILWSELDHKIITICLWVAEQYKKDPFDFSVQEGLLLTQEISLRLHQVLGAHLPFYEQLKVSHLITMHSAYQQYGETAFKVYDAFTLVNLLRKAYAPWQLVSGLVKDKITDELIEKLQQQTQRAIIEECAYLALEIHSGRFKFDARLAGQSQLMQQDQLEQVELEPLRVVVVGQTSVGKSNLINALTAQVLTEVHHLPSTPQKQMCQGQIAEQTVHFIDLAGLDGQPSTEQAMLKEMLQADVILWVIKANQPSRQADVELYRKFVEHYRDHNHINQRQAEIIAVLNQIDLLKPTHDWQPPFDLQQPQTSKEKTIVAALKYNQNLFADIKYWQLLAISDNKQHYGVEPLISQFINCVDKAKNTQLNRRRFERREKVPISQNIKRTASLVKDSINKIKS